MLLSSSPKLFLSGSSGTTWVLCAEPGITSLQNHRVVHVGRDHTGSSGPTSLLTLGLPRSQGTGLCPNGSGITPVKETPQPQPLLYSGVQDLGAPEGVDKCLGVLTGTGVGHLYRTDAISRTCYEPL